jgi:hypothetical protein
MADPLCQANRAGLSHYFPRNSSRTLLHYSRIPFDLPVLCAVARTDLVLRLGLSGADTRPQDTCCAMTRPNRWPLCA